MSIATAPARKEATTAIPRSRLAEVKRGKIATPPRVFLYGEGGLGKSTWASHAPNPIFITADQGANELDIARYPFDEGRFKPESFAEILAAIRDLETAPHEFKTLVVDVLSEVEVLVWQETVRKDSKASNIEDVGGGFQKGYKAALDQWRQILAALERLWSKRNMGIILLDHCSVTKFKNAGGADYGRFYPKIHEFAAGLFHVWSDCTLFAQLETVVVDVEQAKRTVKVRGVSTGNRVVHTVAAAEWLAKNRYDLPEPLPLDWETFAEAVTAHRPADPAKLREAIESKLANADEATATKVRAAMTKAADDAAELARINDKLATLATEKGA